MALDLELAGVVRELADGDIAPPARPLVLKRLRDSHHAVARLIAAGLTEAQISLQTGYALSRLSSLKTDPSFMELLTFYRQNRETVSEAVESRFLMIAQDAAQVVHERLLDEGAEIPLAEAREIFKVFADRAGYAPVQRSVNRNLNLNIGERLDAARRRKESE